MGKIASRIVAVFVSATLAAGLCPAFAFAAEAGKAGMTGSGQNRTAEKTLTIGTVASQSAESDFTVEAVDGGVKITGYTGEGGALDIPATIGGSPVVVIGEAAFLKNSDITSVSIPASVKTIEKGAFAYCYGIESIDLSEGVQFIGDYAFQGAAITSIDLPASVSKLGNEDDTASDVFYDCSALTQIQVAADNPVYASSDGVLYDKGFTTLYYCPEGKETERFAIPSTVKTIAQCAFYRNRLIHEVVIPASVTTIGDWCFAYSAIKAATVPATVKAIGFGPFDNCYWLESLDYQTTAPQPYRMCEECFHLTSVKLPDGLESIGFRAFKGCSDLTSITIPESVKTIESTAFYECTGLTSVTIPDSVTLIEGSAFCYCRNLANVYGCKGVERIEAYAFAYAAISSFPWNKKLRSVSRVAFYECENFANPDFPSYLEYNGSGVYRVYDDTYTITGTVDYAKAKEVLALVNKERAAAGLPNLAMDESLQSAAMLRAAETSLLFSHTRPSGDDCFSVASGMSGENIAAGSSTAEGAMNQWMNSPMHRANILSSSFSSIGVGCITVGSVTYWVQAFGGGTGTDTYAGTGSISASYKVKVDYGEISLKGSGFNLNAGLGAFTAIEPGKKLKLSVGIVNGGWSYVYCPTDPSTYTWKSSNAAVATVSKAGVVTAKAKRGKATITATTPGGKSWSIVVAIGKDIGKALVSWIPDKTYTDKAIKPVPTVTYNGTTLKKGTDYTLSYKNNKAVGQASVTITGKGAYAGTQTAHFSIVQAANKAKAASTQVSKSFKAKSLKSKAAAVALPKVTTTFGTAKWKVTGKDRKGVLTLSGKTVVVKKGAAKGTYTIKLKASVAKTNNYKGASTKTVTVKVRIR